MQGPANHPCGSCPYRIDVPSGVWAEEEYAKLEAYDGETFEQPMGMFMCHQQNGRLCSGWVGCHDMEESFALRIGARHLSDEVIEEIRNFECSVPLFATGHEAAAHGRADIDCPGPAARKLIDKMTEKRGLLV